MSTKSLAIILLSPFFQIDFPKCTPRLSQQIYKDKPYLEDHMYFDLNLVLKAYLDSLSRDPKAVPYINSLDLTGNHYDSIYTTSNTSYIRHRVMSQTRETKAYLKVNFSYSSSSN